MQVANDDLQAVTSTLNTARMPTDVDMAPEWQREPHLRR
jgi:hypothetical protein